MNIFSRLLFNLEERQRLRKENEVLKNKLVKSQENINKTNAYYKNILRKK